ncbi:DUF4302 domain-containing protein [Sphingobacterium alkalisoli]|uniref:DUF4302 domain-containing protein n=1 Tax=Sphingobacterium alkalisoli TaxID=1874115 RepID=A0A4U0GYN1_9SPHI|nr:DUF4302 domain-containing protein [Sphingobacterium alkalisoli]TJY64273.1 DUF4302 domain-containing protein [Sphingobacterium alkalisoli]GGH22772.1 hypothetical protein GCM10011418_29560 [Sphingobacterium alkalisoli]
MKSKIYYLMLFFIGLFISCNKPDIEYTFGEQPEERISKKLDELKLALLSSPYGWRASLNTNVRGGYGFYINFKADETIEMLSDFNTTTSENLKESTYRVRWGMDASLLFDTYNYITMLQDPNPSVNGGTGGQGLQSDVEFEYVHIAQDSIVLRGKRYKNLLLLTKLSQVDQQSYLTGQYRTSIAAVNDYFATHENNYIEIDGVTEKVEIVPNSLNKNFLFQYISNSDGVKSVTYKYNYELGGINFNVPLNVENVFFIRGELKNGEFYLYDTTGKEYPVYQHSSPIMPMEQVFAYNGVYRTLYITGNVMPAGVTSEFNNVFNTTVSKFAGTNRPTRYLFFRLTNSTTFYVEFAYSSGTSNFTATASIPYTREGDIIRLAGNNSLISYSTNWNTRRTQIIDLENYLLGAEFKMDWVTSTDPNVKNLGGLYKTNNPSSFIYGVAQY